MWNTGGCCPEGYVCKTAGVCVPPAGVSYTYDCSAGYFLCPASLDYGCCPDGMGCGVNQCFSTASSTQTIVSVRTTTASGEVERITTTITSIVAPTAPTRLPQPDSEDFDANVLKYFPSEVEKQWPTETPDDNKGGGGGLSTGALVGIVIGAVAFLIIVLVAAFIIIRHLNNVVKAVGSRGSKTGSAASRPHVVMMDRQLADDDDETSGYMRRRGHPRGYSKPSDSDIDAMSVDPSIVTPRTGADRDHGPPTMMTDVTGTSFAGNYQAVSTAHTHNMPGYFDAVAAATSLPSKQTPSSVGRSSSAAARRASGESDTTAFGQQQPQQPQQPQQQKTSTHVRGLSDVSDESSGNAMTVVAPYNAQQPQMTEIHSRELVPELYGSVSPTSDLSPLEDARRRSAASSSLGWYGPTSIASNAHQRARNGNGSGGAGAGRAEIPGLGIVDEEIHGFYGPSDGVAGATREDPDAKGKQQEDDDSIGRAK
jgi:hypothetical protein